MSYALVRKTKFVIYQHEFSKYKKDNNIKWAESVSPTMRLRLFFYAAGPECHRKCSRSEGDCIITAYMAFFEWTESVSPTMRLRLVFPCRWA